MGVQLSHLEIAKNRYLDQVAAALSDQPPVERAELIRSLGEHIDESFVELGDQPTQNEIDQIFANLGDPYTVASQAVTEWVNPATSPAALSSHAMSAPAGIAPWRQQLTGVWVPPAAMILISLGAIFAVFIAPLSLIGAGVFLLLASPLWNASDKARIAVIAVCAGVVGMLQFLFLATLHDDGFIVVACLVVVVPLVLMSPAMIRGIKQAQRAATPRGADPALPIFTIVLLGVSLPFAFFRLSQGVPSFGEFLPALHMTWLPLFIGPLLIMGIVLIQFLPGWQFIERVAGTVAAVLGFMVLAYVMWIQNAKPFFARVSEAKPFLLPGAITALAAAILVVLAIRGYRRFRHTLALTLPEC